MSSGAQFVVASYAVVLFALVMYVVVLALKSARIAREAELLSRLFDRQPKDEDRLPETAEDVVEAEVESADR